jgi:hypothetical protein
MTQNERNSAKHQLNKSARKRLLFATCLAYLHQIKLPYIQNVILLVLTSRSLIVEVCKVKNWLGYMRNLQERFPLKPRNGVENLEDGSSTFIREFIIHLQEFTVSQTISL